jgi:hypothetical protein
MEESILRVLSFQVIDRRRLAGRRRANHVMPAEDLMEDDPVKKTTEPKTEDYSGAGERTQLH